jgi:hypothetical protein
LAPFVEGIEMTVLLVEGAHAVFQFLWKKGADAAWNQYFSRDLRDALRSTVEEWIKTLPAGLVFHSDALFSVVRDEDEGPQAAQLCTELSSKRLPDAELWTAALEEQRLKRRAQGADSPFFLLETAEAAPHLNKLGQALWDTCAADASTFQLTILDAAKRERAEKVAAEALHRKALRLSIDYQDGATAIWILNVGSHVVEDIEVVAVPDTSNFDEGMPGPAFDLDTTSVPGVSVQPILGAWFMATISKLNPNKGLRLTSCRLEPSDFRYIQLDLTWNDHDGLQRKAWVAGDLSTSNHDCVTHPRATIRIDR